MEDWRTNPLLPTLDTSLKARIKNKAKELTEKVKKFFRPKYPSVFGSNEDIRHLNNSDDIPPPPATRRARIRRFFSS